MPLSLPAALSLSAVNHWQCAAWFRLKCFTLFSASAGLALGMTIKAACDEIQLRPATSKMPVRTEHTAAAAAAAAAASFAVHSDGDHSSQATQRRKQS